MAKIKMEGGEEREIEDGTAILKTCEELGVPFGCEDGACLSCMMEVVSGMENLSDKTEAEVDAEVEGNTRLACQCQIKSGEVVIKL